jgi:hypothetical protein
VSRSDLEHGGPEAPHLAVVRDPDPAGRLTYHVARLLAEGIGASRVHPVAGVMLDLGEELRQGDPIEGAVHLARTNRGLLVTGHLTTSLETQCSRCLRDIEVPITVDLAEEALPSLDLTTTSSPSARRSGMRSRWPNRSRRSVGRTAPACARCVARSSGRAPTITRRRRSILASRHFGASTQIGRPEPQ